MITIIHCSFYVAGIRGKQGDMSLCRFSKRNRATKVCDFCKRRKVKCDLGNPCSTCVKYGNKFCRYYEQGQYPNDDINLNSNTLTTATTLLYNDHNSNGISQSAESLVQDQLFQLKEKLRSLEESVQARKRVNYGISQKGSYVPPPLQQQSNSIQPSPPSNHYNNNNNNNNNNSDSNSNSYTPEKPDFTSFKNLIGVNPVASPNDTINFYEGYTSVLGRDDIRRKNFGPLSWITLIKTDTIGSKLWNYLHVLKSGKALKLNFFNNAMLNSNNKPNVMDRHFTQKVSIEEGLQDVKPYSGEDDEVTGMNLGGICGSAVNSAINTDDPKSSNNNNIINNNSNINNININSDDGRRKSTSVKLEGKRSEEDVKIFRDGLAAKAKSLGISFFEGGFSEEMALAEKIQLVLPKQKAIWLLYRRYFTHLYTAIPLIDEVVFKEKVQKLIGYENTHNDETRVQVKVNKKLDFATLGMLLLVIRLSYLTLFTNVASINEAKLQTNDPSPRAQEIKYLLNNPVNLDCIDIAQTCLNQFNLTRPINMEIMQLALYTRIYHCYAPEDGDGSDGGDALVFNAMLVQMAISLGLNRDPDNFPDQCNDEKMNNLGRKMWYMILVFDVNNAMAVGTPLSIDINSFDTKLPYYVPGNENVIDVELEKQTVANISKFGNVFDALADMMKMITNVRGKVKLTELTEKLDFMENKFVLESENLTEIFFNNESLSRSEISSQTVKMKVHFTSNFFMVSIFFHIFNYYERKGNSDLAFFYLKKIFVITIHDLMPFYFEFLDRSEVIFKNSTDLTITPSFESVTHKSCIVLMSIAVRLRLAIHELESHYEHSSKLAKDIKYKIHFDCLKRVCSLIEKCTNVFRESIARLSHRYYYAWRITKAHNFLSTLLASNDFINQFKPPAAQSGIVFNTAMLEEMASILESALFKVKEHKKTRKETEGRPNTFREPSKSESIVNGSRHYADSPSGNVSGNNNTFYTTATDSESRNSMDFSDYSRTRGPPSAASIGSSSSLDNVDEFMPNDQVDSIWIQMMSMKNFNESNPNPTTNINDVPTYNATMNGATAPVINNLTDSSNLAGFTPMFTSGIDLDSFLPSLDGDAFAGTMSNLPLEEIFRGYD
ncbi:uncharacterized protein RJT21DRAFT_134414 [Scheffersomyces amazonensis]|uniref:uncharacterized protein n=1 Tax=Scheffersomyces amazonensis TaxID=1078765 RepID=UPI00315D5812